MLPHSVFKPCFLTENDFEGSHHNCVTYINSAYIFQPHLTYMCKNRLLRKKGLHYLKLDVLSNSRMHRSIEMCHFVKTGHPEGVNKLMSVN